MNHQLNPQLFGAVVEAAKQKCAGDARWCAAIDRAVREIESNPYLHFDGHALLVLSPSSNEIYQANGSCGCRAYGFGQPCWHRCARRLLALYREVERMAVLAQLVERGRREIEG